MFWCLKMRFLKVFFPLTCVFFSFFELKIKIEVFCTAYHFFLSTKKNLDSNMFSSKFFFKLKENVFSIFCFSVWYFLEGFFCIKCHFYEEKCDDLVEKVCFLFLLAKVFFRWFFFLFTGCCSMTTLLLLKTEKS